MGRFENMREELASFQDDIKRDNEQKTKLIQERRKKNKLLLEKSGARELFEKIRDTGLLKITKMDSNKESNSNFIKRLFGRISRDDSAEIKDDIIYSSRHGKSHSDASITLRFNYSPKPNYHTGVDGTVYCKKNFASDFFAFYVTESGELFFCFQNLNEADSEGYRIDKHIPVANRDITELVTETIKINLEKLNRIP